LCALPVTQPQHTGADPLSLHDALPISGFGPRQHGKKPGRGKLGATHRDCRRKVKRLSGSTTYETAQRSLRGGGGEITRRRPALRSEEHTSELQSRENLVCRLLLEKKNK